MEVCAGACSQRDWDSLHPLRGRVSVEQWGPTGKCESNWERCVGGVLAGYSEGVRGVFGGIRIVFKVFSSFGSLGDVAVDEKGVCLSPPKYHLV